MEYGVCDNVVMFTVKGSIFSPAFFVAYDIHDLLGHLDYKVVVHFLKDVVLVKFKTQFATPFLHGANLKQETCSGQH